MKDATTGVAAESLNPAWKICPVCHSDKIHNRELVLQRVPEVWMLRCDTCYACFAERFPCAEYLQELYNPDHYCSSLTSERRLSQRCADRIFRQYEALEFTKGPLQILDYGGNSGILVEELRHLFSQRYSQRDIEGTVVDLYPQPGREGIRCIAPAVFVTEQRQYDIVLASAVLEHLPNMREVTHSLLDVAKSQSLFYARTPFDVPLAKLHLGYSVRWPRHLFDFGDKFWNHFSQTFPTAGTTLVSEPSLVETSLSAAPLRTIAAHLLKAPELARQRLPHRLAEHLPVWRFVGGWETFVCFDGDREAPGDSAEQGKQGEY